MTVQRAIHVVYPETRPWGFILSDENDDDRKIFQYFMWTLPLSDNEMTQERHLEVGRKSVVVAFQPPWILSEQDIKEFAQCRSVCPFTSSFLNASHVFPVSSVPSAG